MKIQMNGIWLADGDTTHVRSFKMNGLPLNVDALLFSDFFLEAGDLGGSALTATFTVSAAYTSAVESDVALLTYFASLPTDGDVSFYAGEPHETQAICTLSGAVLESSSVEREGLGQVRTFKIRGDAITSGSGARISGGGYYAFSGGPEQGSIDGGGYADALIPSTLSISGGAYA